MDAATMLSALSDYGFGDEGQATQLRAIQDTIWEIEGRMPWPWIESSVTLNFTGSSTSPSNMPSDFRAVVNLVDVASGAKIRWVRSDEYDDLIGSDSPAATVGGILLAYWDGTTLQFYPQPLSTQTVKMRYIRWSPAITGSSVEGAFLLPPQFHRLIMYGAVARMYDMEDEPDLAARYDTRFENGIGRMQEALSKKQYMQADHIFITDPDDYYDF